MGKKKEEVAPFVAPGGGSPVVAAAPAAFPGAGAPAPAAFQPFAAPANLPQVITGAVNADDFAMQLYLKGSDVPMDQGQVKVKILAFVKLPGSRSPLVAQIEPSHGGKQYLPLNKTNIKQIAAITGQNDLRCILNRYLILTVYPVNNPSSGTMARGLYVSGAE